MDGMVLQLLLRPRGGHHATALLVRAEPHSDLTEDSVTVVDIDVPGGDAQAEVAYAPGIFAAFLARPVCVWRLHSRILGQGIAAIADADLMGGRRDFNFLASAVCRREVYGSALFFRFETREGHDTIGHLLPIDLFELLLARSAAFRLAKRASRVTLGFCGHCRLPFRSCPCLALAPKSAPAGASRVRRDAPSRANAGAPGNRRGAAPPRPSPDE